MPPEWEGTMFHRHLNIHPSTFEFIRKNISSFNYRISKKYQKQSSHFHQKIQKLKNDRIFSKVSGHVSNINTTFSQIFVENGSVDPDITCDNPEINPEIHPEIHLEIHPKINADSKKNI